VSESPATRPYRRRWLAVTLAALVVSSAVSWWLGARLDSPTSRAARAQPPPPTLITAAVERRRLVEEVQAGATVRLAGSQAVPYESASSAVAAVITDMPLQVGSEVAAGQQLFEVSGRPVFALPGEFPAYRDLVPGMTGPDVRQLQRGLWELGYGTGGDHFGVFGGGTQAAVTRFYQRTTYEPWKPPGAKGPQVGLPRQELAFVRQLPARVTSIRTGVGGRPDGTVVTLGLGDPIAEAAVPAVDALQIEPGQAGTITSPGQPSVAVQVTSVGKITTDRTGRDTARVVLRPASPDIRVGARHTFRAVLRSSRPSDLVVPVTALWAAGGDRVKVTVLDGSDRRDVEVDVVITVDGEAAVRPSDGAALTEDDQVVVGSRGPVPTP
jgi:hypothetical protein